MVEVHRANSNSADEPDGDGNIGDSDSEISAFEIENDSDIEDEEDCIEDPDGPILNNDSLLQIKCNDPDITSIVVYDLDHRIGRKDAGHYIGDNTHLNQLFIKGGTMPWESPLAALSMLARFCDGLARNSSIEDLNISDCELSIGKASNTPEIKKLSAYIVYRTSQFCFQNIKLRSIELNYCDLGDQGARVISSALKKKDNKSFLQQICLSTNEISDIVAKELIESLKGYENLEILNLASNSVSTQGCAALGDLFSSGAVKLNDISLTNNRIGDDGISAFITGLANSTPSNEIRLDLRSNRGITNVGWLTLNAYLQNPSCCIVNLDIGSNSIDDGCIAALGKAVASNTSLKALVLSADHEEDLVPIPSAAWQSLIPVSLHSDSVLQDIYLESCHIDGEGLDVLANALNNNPRIKVLHLGDNPQASGMAWKNFFNTCMQSPTTSLEALFLCENELSDDVIADMAQVLSNNDTLEVLDLEKNPSITESGWENFSRLFCDKSSINSTYASNHKLHDLGLQELPPELVRLLGLNEKENKKEVAREKILLSHFLDGQNDTDFLDVELGVLPHVISWIGRDYSGTPETEDTSHNRSSRNNVRVLLYQLLKRMPQLLPSRTPRYAGKKRKFSCEFFSRGGGIPLALKQQ